MQFYLVKRLFMTFLVLFLLTVLLSLLVHIVPGDPARTLLGPRATEKTVARVRAAMDLDKPLHVQVGNFIKNLLHGSFGNDVFSGRPNSGQQEYPALNVWVGEDDAVVTAEIPGVVPDSLDISVADETLTIKGERPEPKLADNATRHRQERSYGSFTRTITLPYRVEAGKVKASYERGILSVSLPRAEVDKPRKITVKA